LERQFCEIFAQAGFKLQFSWDFSLPHSWDYRREYWHLASLLSLNTGCTFKSPGDLWGKKSIYRGLTLKDFIGLKWNWIPFSLLDPLCYDTSFLHMDKFLFSIFIAQWFSIRTNNEQQSRSPQHYFLLGFELRAHTSSHSTYPFCFVMGIFEMGSRELFAQAGLKPRSSWSLPPE
jgi:hypothetical protein